MKKPLFLLLVMCLLLLSVSVIFINAPRSEASVQPLTSNNVTKEFVLNLNKHLVI